MEKQKRALPHSVEAEMVTLGTMMLFGDGNGTVATVRDILSRDDFYRDTHAHIFDGMVALHSRSEPVDLVNLKDELQRRDTLEAIGGIGYLFQLNDLPFTEANVASYARIVQEKAIARRLAYGARQIADMVYGEGGAGSDEDGRLQLARAQQIVLDCAGEKAALNGAGWQSSGQIYDDLWKELDERFQSGGGISGLETGLSRVDQILNGLNKEDLIVLGARPGMGKTGMAGTIAAGVAFGGQTVAVFSCEMSGKKFLQRMWSAQALVPFRRIQKAQWDSEEGMRLGTAQDRLQKAPIFIDSTPKVSITALHSRAKALHVRQPLDLIIVDYLQYLSGEEGRRYPSKHDEIGDIAIGLKQLARDLNIPVVALAQLNRGVESREDKRPLLSDLAQSGRIEAEADIVSFLYRPSYYEGGGEARDADDDASSSAGSQPQSGYNFPTRPPVTELMGGPREDAEFIVAKNRNGPTGIVKLSFAPKCMRFDNLASGTF